MWLFKLEIQRACYFCSPAILFELMYWHVLSLHLILPVKTRIICKSLNEVCKQTTFRNLKRDKGCRENTTIDHYFVLVRLKNSSIIFFFFFFFFFYAKVTTGMSYYLSLNQSNFCRLFLGYKIMRE